MFITCFLIPANPFVNGIFAWALAWKVRIKVWAFFWRKLLNYVGLKNLFPFVIL